jgi:hypothetical protein
MARRWIQTLDLRISSRELYHCATTFFNALGFAQKTYFQLHQLATAPNKLHCVPGRFALANKLLLRCKTAYPNVKKLDPISLKLLAIPYASPFTSGEA